MYDMGKVKRDKDDKEWSNLVKDRFGRKCAVCGATHYLNAHHIIPIEVRDYRYDVDNGIALCPRHHKYSNKLSPHKNPVAFIKWMKIHYSDILEIAMERCNINDT